MTTAVSLDFGTSSLKVAVTDTDRGVLGEADREYAIRQPFPTWAEQDPAELWELAGAACREAIEHSGIPDLRQSALNRSLAVGDLPRDEEHGIAGAVPTPKS